MPEQHPLSYCLPIISRILSFSKVDPATLCRHYRLVNRAWADTIENFAGEVWRHALGGNNIFVNPRLQQQGGIRQLRIVAPNPFVQKFIENFMFPHSRAAHQRNNNMWPVHAFIRSRLSPNIAFGEDTTQEGGAQLYEAHSTRQQLRRATYRVPQSVLVKAVMEASHLETPAAVERLRLLLNSNDGDKNGDGVVAADFDVDQPTEVNLCPPNRGEFRQSMVRRVDATAETTFATPLMLAARTSSGREVVDLLLRHGAAVRAVVASADANASSSSKPPSWTPLHFAARFGRVDAARALLEQMRREENCRLPPQTAEGHTPLHFACWSGSLEIVQELVAFYHGNAEDSVMMRHHLNDCLILACAQHTRDETSADLVRFLLDDRRVDVLQPGLRLASSNDSLGFSTAWQVACAIGNVRILRAWLSHPRIAPFLVPRSTRREGGAKYTNDHNVIVPLLQQGMDSARSMSVVRLLVAAGVPVSQALQRYAPFLVGRADAMMMMVEEDEDLGRVACGRDLDLLKIQGWPRTPTFGMAQQ